MNEDAMYFKRLVSERTRSCMQGMTLAMLLYAIFGVLDWYMFPEIAKYLLPIRLFFIATAIVMIVVIKFYSALYLKWSQSLLCLTTLVGGFGIVWMNYLLAPFAHGDAYYAGILLTIVFSTVFFPIRFRYVVAISSLLIVGYNLSLLLYFDKVTIPVVVSNNFFLMAFAVVGAASCLSNERLSFSKYRADAEIEEKNLQLESASQHKSDFVANMSHELRTPLNAIIGFSEVLREEMFGEVNAKQAEYLEDINSSGKHLLALINDILDLSKIEAGKMDLELSPLDMETALGDAMTLLRDRATRSSVVLELQCPAPIGTWLADVRKFKQIMVNLLSNAVKFTPSGGRVTVRAERLAGEVRIAVSDTGIGIRPEDQELIFEAFRQATGDHLQKSEGTGLGLALTRRFVELHGGRLSLQSEPGHGSTFTFNLPGREQEHA